MKLSLINPSNPLVSMVHVRESRWNCYRVWKPLSLMVLADIDAVRRGPSPPILPCTRGAGQPPGRFPTWGTGSGESVSHVGNNRADWGIPRDRLLAGWLMRPGGLHSSAWAPHAPLNPGAPRSWGTASEADAWTWICARRVT